MIDKIRSSYLSGDFQSARELLHQCSKRYEHLSDAEKSFVTGMLINVNENEKALSLLKKEKPLDQLINESVEGLKRQIYLAQIKINIKSIDIGIRILKNVLMVVEGQIENFDKGVLRGLFQIAASNLRIVDEYETILKIEKNYPYPDKLELRDYLFKLEVFRAQHSLTLEPNDLTLFHNFFKNALEGEILQYLITIHEIKAKMLFGYLTAEECDTIESRLNRFKTPPTHESSHYFLIGHAKFLIKKTSEALPYLKKALAVSNFVHESHSIIYLINKIDPKSISREDQILLRCAPVTSAESYLTGNRYLQQLPHLYPIYKNDLSIVNPQQNDCWWVTKNEIILKNYFEIYSSEKTIDLYSGTIIENGQVKMILTDLRIKLVRLIFGCGNVGAHQSYLIDALFDGTYYFYESAHLRLKNLVAELNKMGIHINRRKNFYFYNFDKNKFNIIFPCNHTYLGPLIYLSKAKEGAINRKAVETKLNIKPSTASLYLKQWKEKDFIQKDTAKYGEFKINTKTFGV